MRRDFLPQTEDVAAEIDAGLCKQGPHVRVQWGDEDAVDVPHVMSPAHSPMFGSQRGSINSDGSSAPPLPPPNFFPASPPAAGAATVGAGVSSPRVAGTGLLPRTGTGIVVLPPPPSLLPLSPASEQGVRPLPAAAGAPHGHTHGHGMLPPLQAAQHHHHEHLAHFEPPPAHAIAASSPRLAPLTKPVRDTSFVRQVSGGSGGGGSQGPRQVSGGSGQGPPPAATRGTSSRPSAAPISSGSVLQLSAQDALGSDQQRLARMGVVEASSLRNFDYSNLNRGGVVSPSDKVPSPTPEAEDTYH
jgi:hypothetical protein